MASPRKKWIAWSMTPSSIGWEAMAPVQAALADCQAGLATPGLSLQEPGRELYRGRVTPNRGKFQFRLGQNKEGAVVQVDGRGSRAERRALRTFLPCAVNVFPRYKTGASHPG